MEITRELFLRQCRPRFGAANPERMHLEHWEWMVRTGKDPYYVRQDLDLLSEWNYRDPDWCFKRFGMSRTPMPDGRIICIAGEHEDGYDPNFCIYNDVIVLRPAEGQANITLDSGKVEIYGYPKNVFPPTDFHSATLVNEHIFIIGRLGYQGTREPADTPIYTLNTKTYEVQPITATGTPPGWIYKHHAAYDPAAHAITVRGGYIEQRDFEKQTPYTAAHRLRLNDMTWERLADRETHRRFLLKQSEYDGRSTGVEPQPADFQPPYVPHTWLGTEQYGDNGIPKHAIDIRGVRVTFEELTDIRMFVEGDLSWEIIDQLLTDVTNSLRETTGRDWSYDEVDTFGD